MKRFFFSSIALMVAMTSCTESGLIDAPEFYGNPIVFDTYIGKTPVTKAVNCGIETLKATENNGGGARIYAFETAKEAAAPSSYSTKYLDGKLLFANSAWGYYEDGQDPVDAYMPAGSNLSVVAYNLNTEGADAEDVKYMSDISADKTEFIFTVKDDVAEQVDLVITPLTLVNENPTGGDTRVPLRFFHLLSRVGFKVKSTSETDNDITITSVRLKGDFYTTGKVDLKKSKAMPSAGTTATDLAFQTSKPEITPISKPANPTEYELLPGATSFTTKAASCYATPLQITPEEGGCYMMVMPGVQETAEITVAYQVYDATKEVTFKLADMNTGINYFQAGYAYEFILKVSTDAIEFSAEIPTDWDETDPIPVTPNN